MKDEVKIPLIIGIFFFLIVTYNSIAYPLATDYTYSGYIDSVEFPKTRVYLHYRNDTLVHFSDGNKFLFYGYNDSMYIPEKQNVTLYFHRNFLTTNIENSLFLDRVEVNK